MPDLGLRRLAHQLAQKLQHNALIQATTQALRQDLDCDRVLLYYFYRHWSGQVTFEALRSPHLSIFGSTGADDCFNQDYAQLYQEGRVRAIPDIETEAIHPCHRDFLRTIQVRANLAVPILTDGRLWGLLIAHQLTPRPWFDSDITAMEAGAKAIARQLQQQ